VTDSIPIDVAKANALLAERDRLKLALFEAAEIAHRSADYWDDLGPNTDLSVFTRLARGLGEIPETATDADDRERLAVYVAAPSLLVAAEGLLKLWDYPDSGRVTSALAELRSAVQYARRK
jgi:hypothetical protein